MTGPEGTEHLTLLCPERSRTLLGHSRDLSQGEHANMWIEVLLPAQCLVMGGRGPLRPHSAAERSAHTTWKSAVSVHIRGLVGGIASSEPLPLGCAREPAAVRVLSVNSRRLMPTATKNAPATS